MMRLRALGFSGAGGPGPMPPFANAGGTSPDFASLSAADLPNLGVARASGTCRRLRRTWAILALIGVLTIALAVSGVRAADQPGEPVGTDLTQLSIEELMNVEIEVTSVSKKAEKLSETTAAVYVITQEDIRRSGATSIPELLRMAPGFHVAQIDANNWLVGARGLSDRFANKVLIMIDGRSVYSPMLSGVWWDVQDMLLEDIDRIEIIRGPGATTWGANAVNGLVNIITKHAGETQEQLLIRTTGTQERSVIAVETGGRLSDHVLHRFYAKYFDRDGFVDSSGRDAHDGWRQSRMGFRADSERPNGDSLVVTGHMYTGRGEQTLVMPSLTPPYAAYVEDDFDVSGANVLARWNHRQSENSSMSLQLYLDRTRRHDFRFSETGNTVDLDFQHRLDLGTKHDMVWGIGYRHMDDNLASDNLFDFNVPSRTTRLLSAFIQDDIDLSPDRLRLTVGSKLENNSFTGFEVQPSIRLLWKPQQGQSVWAAVSRAVRTPCRFESDSNVHLATLPGTPETGGLPMEMVLYGVPDLESEKLTACELGYRLTPNKRFSLDMAAYYNVYNDFRSFEMGSPTMSMDPIPHLIIPLTLGNTINARSSGFEVSGTYRVTDRWRLAAGYSSARIHMSKDPTSADALSGDYGDLSPKQQFHLRSYLDLSDSLELDAFLYYVDGIKSPTIVLPSPAVPAYTRLDLRLGWRPKPNLDVSLVLQNALDPYHPEYGISFSEVATEVERSVYGRLTWRY